MSRQLNDWYTWKEVCSVDGCPEDARERMSEFLEVSGKRYFKSWSIKEGEVDVGRAVACFDQHLWVTETTKGKCWKDHMMAYAAQPQNIGNEINVLRSYARGVLRTAIRKYLVSEGQYFPTVRRLHTVSADQHVTNSEGKAGPTLIDAHAKNTEASIRDVYSTQTFSVDEPMYNQIAAELAPELWGESTDTEKLMISAVAMGIPISHPLMLDTLGVKKSQASIKLKQFLNVLPDKIAEKFPEDDAECVFHLSKHVMVQLTHLVERDLLSLPRGVEIQAEARRRAEKNFEESV